MAAASAPVPLTTTSQGTGFAVRVIPRAGRTAIAGVRGGALLLRLGAAPVDGAANEELVAFLAKQFGRPKRSVAIVSGHNARDKRVVVSGLSAAEAAARLSDILSSL
jgi:uncharacterized protein (TIGR00251 family)